MPEAGETPAPRRGARAVGLILGTLAAFGLFAVSTHLWAAVAPATAPASSGDACSDEAQFRLLETCTEARAPLGLPATLPASRRGTTTRPAARLVSHVQPIAANPAGAPDPAAIAALRAHLVHVEQVARDSNRLSVDFSAMAASTQDADVRQLLEPVLPWLESLSLARCQIGDPTAQLLARAMGLEYLNLSGTRVTDRGVAALAPLQRLSELVLARTHLTDAAAETLAAMPALKRAVLWRSGLSKAAIARLRQLRPRLRVEAGDSPVATTREAEPEVKFSSEAPPPGKPGVAQTRPAVAAVVPQTQPAAAAAARPINTVCPVSGKPVDPRYTILYHGQVIGFCCPHCPTQFWEHPDQFEGKLLSAAPASGAAAKKP